MEKISQIFTWHNQIIWLSISNHFWCILIPAFIFIVFSCKYCIVVKK